jgi:BON domain
MSTANLPLGAVTEDDLLERRVRAYLSGLQMPALRALYVEARNGVVTIRGQVSTFYERQLSQHLARRVAGVRKIVDLVVVRPQQSTANQVIQQLNELDSDLADIVATLFTAPANRGVASVVEK